MSAYKGRTPCVHCKAPVKRFGYTYCSNRCQRDKEQADYVARWLEGSEAGVRVDGCVSAYIRRYLLATFGEQCSRCKWAEVNETTGRVPLEVEHIDGNWQNNRPDNLCLLCPNCHALTPTYRALNRGNGRSYRKKYYNKAA